MFCNKCGKELPEGVTVCDECYVAPAPVYKEEESDKKGSFKDKIDLLKSKKEKLIKPCIIGASAVVAVIIVIACLNAGLYNKIVKTILPADKYTQYTIGKNLKDMTGLLNEDNMEVISGVVYASTVLYDIDSSYGEDESGLSKEEKLIAILASFTDGSIKLSAEAEMTDELKELVEEAAEDEADMVTWIENANLEYSVTTEKNGAGIEWEGKINGEDMASAQASASAEDGAVYLSMPSMMEDDIKINIADTDNEDYKEAIEATKKMSKAAPSAKTIEKIMTRYLEGMIEQIEDVEEGKEVVKIGNVSQKLTTLTIDVDDTLVYNMAKSALNEAKEDDQIKDIIRDYAEATPDADADKIVRDFEAGIEDGLESLEDIEIEGTKLAEVTLFVNAKGEITGIEVETEDEYDPIKVATYDIKKGSKCAALVEVSSGMYNFKIEGEGKELFGNRSMEYAAKAMGNEFVKFSTSGFDINDIKKGVLEGKIEIALGDSLESYMKGSLDDEYIDLLSETTFVFDVNAKSLKNAKVKAELLVDNKDVVKAKLESKDSGSIKFPKKTVEYDNTDDIDIEPDYTELKKALEKAGAPSELIDSLK